MAYEPAALEPKWQERWRELRVFEARRDPDRPKYYVYNPAPYVTGSLHMGHVRNYACGDFVARFRRLRGAAVLYTIGFDAYGLPTEMAAIRNALAPERWTADCLKEMKRQLVALGCGFDWRRSFLTSEPRYYRWTQWLFLQLYERNLIYSTVGNTYWCPQCETSLARAQVEEGGCWICATPVERRKVREWRLRLSARLEELLNGLGEMRDLNGLADQGQRNLIAPRGGFGVPLRLAEGDRRITAFMQRRDDWSSACVLVVHARDEATLGIVGEGDPFGSIDREVKAEVLAAFSDARFARTPAIEIGSGRALPVVITAMLDPAFVDQPIVFPSGPGSREEPWTGRPIPEFDALTVYRQKDFSISRQRLWGTPIPIVLCADCGEQPVPEQALPVVAPRIVFDPATRKLQREDSEWDLRPCPRCGKQARLEPQVMDCHMDSLWHPFRPCALEHSEFLFDPDEMRYWMPADIIQFGRDVIPFMLDLRFLSHFLHDLGHVPFREFCRDVLAHGLIVHEGRKMSKHLGNVVTPEEIIRTFGADALRFYVLAHAEPRSDFRWSEEGIRRYHAALSSYWDVIQCFVRGETSRGEDLPDAPHTPKSPGAPNAPNAFPNAPNFGKYTTIFLKKTERELGILEASVDAGRYDRYAGALERLVSGMSFFAVNHLAKERHPGFARMWRSIVQKSTLYLAPVAPHLAEECWELLGNEGSVFAQARFPADPTPAPEGAHP